MINGLDILILLRLSLEEARSVPSKKLTDDLHIPPSEVSASLKRCKASTLLHWSDLEKRVNRTGLLEFLTHGLKYVFPAERGAPTRGIPTASAASPLKAYFTQTASLPPVWPYFAGEVQGYAFTPLNKYVPEAALQDEKLYVLLALCDAIRGERARERSLAAEELKKRLGGHARS
jgi:hypothetical protein